MLSIQVTLEIHSSHQQLTMTTTKMKMIRPLLENSGKVWRISSVPRQVSEKEHASRFSLYLVLGSITVEMKYIQYGQEFRQPV
mmetsp:Transcript_16087/g.18033  ORF Transcript_16087/g.18033 Transcript_16087/m.18033 type:complete len:83 (+) Transcript_16087:305-553(+)